MILLVTGASGTLGGPLTERAAASGWDVMAAFFSRVDRIRAGTPLQVDLRDREAVRDLIRQYKPDVIIHAAVTERSGPGFEEAIRLSGRHLAACAVENGIRLIALSTDLVFDGTEPIYTEASIPRPMSSYGRAKMEAERDILAIYPAALIVRTSLIYDFDPQNAQVGWMLKTIQQGEALRLFTDQIRCPIWVFNLADALLELAEKDSTGILNLVGPEALSRYDLGAALLSALGIESPIIGTSAPDTMPKRLVLSIERAQKILKTSLLPIDQAITLWLALKPAGQRGQ
jgi:dTDP-4-dehydrorhamnose reductase